MSEFSVRLSAQQLSDIQLRGLLQELNLVACGNFPGPYISELPEAERLLSNDGTMTHLVHSTHEAAAEQISVSGLNIPELGGQPAPWRTTYMLEGPNGLVPQGPANRLLMDYRYGRGNTSLADAKVVLTFPIPRPSDIDPKVGYRHPHANSDLVNSGSRFLLRAVNGGLFFPREFVEGYFLHNTLNYVPNPNFYSYGTTAVSGLSRLMDFVSGWRKSSSSSYRA